MWWRMSMNPTVNMADLSVLAYANNFTLWHYKTKESEDAALSRGYFNKAVDMMRAGDVIIMQTSVEAVFKSQQVVVRSCEKGLVSIERHH